MEDLKSKNNILLTKLLSEVEDIKNNIRDIQNTITNINRVIQASESYSPPLTDNDITNSGWFFTSR
jgi:predicted  nucleic acid-binding Zn-ribbon protein